MSQTSDNEAFALHAQRRLATLGTYKGSLDSWAGPQTRAAFDAALPAPKGSPAPSSSGSNSSRLYAHAERDKGLAETPGKASTPRIRHAILAAASWLDPDDSTTAWCGCILGLWCSEIGLKTPSEYFRAASWLNVGTAVTIDNAKKGDVVVLSRQGGNHVGLYSSHDAKAGTITLLGGNQSNAVNLSTYKLATLKGIRAL